MPAVRKKFYILLCWALATACTTPAQQKTGKSSHATSEKNEHASDTASGPPSATRLPHPPEATYRAARTLVMTESLPPETRLYECSRELDAIAKTAENEKAMVEAEQQTQRMAAENPSLYHWCFYATLVDLEEMLRANEPTLEKQADRFFHGMRKLWILARGLDQAMGDTRYFSYLRNRYIGLSKTLFGRPVEVVAPPLHGLPRSATPAH